MDDLISRQAAIDAIESHIRTAEEPYQLTQAEKVLNHAFEIAASCVYNLPSAQPTYTEADIQKIQDLEQAQFDTMYQLGYEEGKKAAQTELSDEEKRLIKQLRSYHNGSYAKVIDKLLAPRVADAMDIGREEGGE